MEGILVETCIYYTTMIHASMSFDTIYWYINPYICLPEPFSCHGSCLLKHLRRSPPGYYWAKRFGEKVFRIYRVDRYPTDLDIVRFALPIQLYNDAKRHFRQIHPCLSSFERTNEKLCRKRTIPTESANRKIEGKGGRLHLQFSRAGFGCYGPWGNYLPPYLLRPRSSNLNVK